MPLLSSSTLQEGVQPQLYADNLRCLSGDPGVLRPAARFTIGYVRLVGQEPAPSKSVLLSTSREVRRDMKDWVLSDSGDQWSIKFDVRDFGGHLDTTFRGWSSTLAAWVRLVISRLVLIFVLPLDFHGRVRVVRPMYLIAALHGIESSLLASDSLRKLRSSTCGCAVVMLVAPSLPSPLAGGEVWRAETDLPFSVIGGVSAMLDATPSCGLCSGFAHPGRSPPCFQFPLLAATLDSAFKNVKFIVLAPVSVVFSVDVHSTGAGKAKEGKCQKLKPSFEDYDLCEVRFADSAPQVWLRGLHGHVLGLRIFVVRFLTLVNLLSVLVGNISLAFSGLVTMTLCHEQRGSRSAFAQAKATPRVDVAETPKVKMELEKPECRFPVFVRTFSGTRTFYASSSMLISDFMLLVSQSTAVPETSFYLTFQGTLLHGGHTIGEVGIGRDASLTMRGRLLGGANKGASFPQFHEWYCVRCQRGGCWATKFSCFRCGLSRLESEAAMGGFLQPTSKGGGKGKGVFREAQYPGRGGDGVPRNVPPTTRRVPNSGKPSAGSSVQIDQLIGLLTGLGCSACVLGAVEEAVKAKSKPRVVPAAEHTVFVLKEKWDRAEAHRKFLQEHAERKQQEYEAASQRATDQAVLADDLKRQYWKARKELDKTAASCASASVGERESVNSDDGLANVGLDDEEMGQVYPECMLDTQEAPPAKRAKGKASANNPSSDQPVGETVPVPPPVTQIQNLHLCQDEQQIMRAVQSWTPEALDTVVRLCTEHRNQEEALKGSLG